ncbi:DinB family protein [Deminuibacter soli]|uniref:DinB-like domain-containing protein n=1 Tax=Deminuibacter soli TaxID=2291815 RepID=A0A3E1NEV3_9BACT|nr:DinB family protein [Deminuibacter soli]RFM26509.1 hypothetical protein DXN05_20020 [Deminuibacter soli]
MDLNHYLAELDNNTRNTLDIVDKYSATELLFKEEETCSIADLLEHICISDNRTINLLKSDTTSVAATEELYGDARLQQIVVDYQGGPKITETELRELQGAVTDYSSFEAIFTPQREALKQALLSGEIAITHKTYPHQYLGDMTVTDWLKYIIYHTNRHLNDIMADSMEFKKSIS